MYIGRRSSQSPDLHRRSAPLGADGVDTEALQIVGGYSAFPYGFDATSTGIPFTYSKDQGVDLEEDLDQLRVEILARLLADEIEDLFLGPRILFSSSGRWV